MSRRNAPDAYIGYVFLFFYGLERRALDPASPCPTEELAAIADEVERLLGIYTNSGSFQGYAGNFLEKALLPRLPGRIIRLSPEPQSNGTGLPAALRIAIQRYASEQTPIPPDWAYQWVVTNPLTRLGTPAQRCRADFKRLFLKRYASRFGEGLKIKGRAGADTVIYHPASASFGGGVEIRLAGEGIPRAIPERIPQRLQDLVDDCVAGLDAYSRWIGRNPGRERSIGALSLLPPELIDLERKEPVKDIVAEIESGLAGGKATQIPGAVLLRRWPRTVQGRLGKSDYVGIAQLLEKLGYGLEPDVRFCGARFEETEPIVVFRLKEGAATAPTPEYKAATQLLHLAALVALADGSVTSQEESHLLAHLERSLNLGRAEGERLEAHLRWLTATKPSLTGIKKRVEGLSADQRERLGEFLVTVAGADGILAASEIAILQKIYQRIGIDPARLYRHIHALSTETVDSGPITIIPPLERSREYGVPPPEPTTGAGPRSIQLNAAMIEKKLQQSAAVAVLLADVFAGEDATEPSLQARELVTPGDVVTGLDSAHSALLRRLAARDLWPRAEFDTLADSMNVMPEGAIDRLNEAAYEAIGEPVLEDDDPLVVDHKVLGEMIR
jgi:tellurite resistance protein